jgi:AcrR family transcriptional regulator
MEGMSVAYEVIKRVGGRAYRYRVESFRDPETRRVRGKWTYLGRVEGEGTLSPERQARPSSRSRLLNALEELLESRDLSALTTGIIATRAGLAYGTFYRYFKDVHHIVREAMLRHSTTTDRLLDGLFADVSTAVLERGKIANWVGEMIAEAQAHPGLIRAWHVASNQDSALVAERQARFDASVKSFAQYIEKLNAAGLTTVKSPAFNAYALVALCTAIVRECAVETVFVPAKTAGLLAVIVDLLGLPADEYAEVADVAVAS